MVFGTEAKMTPAETYIASAIGWAVALDALATLDNGPDGLPFTQEEATEGMTADTLYALYWSGYVARSADGRFSLTPAGRAAIS